MLNSNNISFIMASINTKHNDFTTYLESMSNDELKAEMIQIAIDEGDENAVCSFAEMSGCEIRTHMMDRHLKSIPLKDIDNIWIKKTAKKYNFYPKEILKLLKLNEYITAKNLKQFNFDKCSIKIGGEQYFQNIEIMMLDAERKNAAGEIIFKKEIPAAFTIASFNSERLFIQYLFVLPEFRQNGICDYLINNLKGHLNNRTLVAGTNNPQMVRILHNRGFKCQGKMGDGIDNELEFHYKH